MQLTRHRRFTAPLGSFRFNSLRPGDGQRWARSERVTMISSTTKTEMIYREIIEGMLDSHPHLAGTLRKAERNRNERLLKLKDGIRLKATSKNMNLQKQSGHEKAALRRPCKRIPYDDCSRTSLVSRFNPWRPHVATTTCLRRWR